MKNTQICDIDYRLSALLFVIKILISTRVLDSRFWWSPSGQILVFAVRGQLCLYSLWFISFSGDSSTARPSVANQVCVKWVDLSPYTFRTQML